MATTEEIKAMLTDPEQSEEAITAAVVFCNEKEQEYKDKLAAQDEEIASLRAKIDEHAKASKDAFIEDLVCSGKLAPKDEAMKSTWCTLYDNDPDGARLMAKNMPGKDDENIAGGKAGSVEDGRSAAQMFQDDLECINK